MTRWIDIDSHTARCDALAPARRACRCELLLGHAGKHETHDWEAIPAGMPLVPVRVQWKALQ